MGDGLIKISVESVGSPPHSPFDVVEGLVVGCEVSFGLTTSPVPVEADGEGVCGIFVLFSVVGFAVGLSVGLTVGFSVAFAVGISCLLYTSDAADE